MKDHQEEINELLRRIDSLERRQASFSREIDQLKDQVNNLRLGIEPQEAEETIEKIEESKPLTPPGA